MKTNTAKKITPETKPSSQNSNHLDSINLISSRQSKELVVGFCGPIGAGVKVVRRSLEKELARLGYEIKHIRISSLMSSIKTTSSISDQEPSDAYGRYVFFQDKGDGLREEYGPQILAEAAIHEIAKLKQQLKGVKGDKPDDRFSGKVVYIIDQLKNPAEVELLRLVYQNNFYLIGVLRHESERKRNLRDESITPKDIDELIHRDRKSAGKEGQHTEKTILDSDFFIKNNQSHVAEIDKKIFRFVNLIHGKNGLSPTLVEKGMYSAFSASFQSACLSRQVGAAILDLNGNIVATGRNDVPKSGGGLYSHEDGDADYRCIHKGGKCYNDAHKEKIKRKIISEVQNELHARIGNIGEGEFLREIGADFAKEIANRVLKNTSVGSLIEYSRAIHAEMDAITSLARIGGYSTFNKILFTTTYPCHNCARHIVASGIKKVYYIEPYEKSLAIDLHDDAINDVGLTSEEKVTFSQFEGVSPRRYQKFFFSTGVRKEISGEASEYATKYNNHVDIQFLDSYQEIEDKIFKMHHDKFHNK